MRLNIKGMNARRATQPMVIPLASCTTPQMPFYVQTLRAGHALHAWRCCSLLIWNDQTLQFAPSPARKAWPTHIRFLLKQALTT